MNSKKPKHLDFDEYTRRCILDVIASLREQLASMQRISRNEEYSRELREQARGLIHKIMWEMKYEKEHLDYERRLQELESK